MQTSLTDRARWARWLAAALVAVLVVMWWHPWADDVVVPAPVPAPAVAQRMHPADPSTSAPPAPTPVATPAPALKLVGTTVGGASSFATVLRTGDSQVLLLHVGDRVDGLAVSAIEPDRIVLAGAAEPIVIETDRTLAVRAPPVLPRAVSPAASEPPTWPEGEAPWDAGPNFRH